MHRHRRDDASPRRGFLTVLVARLIPVVPFTVVNYLAGATALRLRLFLSATALGIVPAHVALGDYGSRAPLVAVLDRPHRAGSAHCRWCAGLAGAPAAGTAGAGGAEVRPCVMMQQRPD